MERTLCYVGILIEDVCVPVCCELNLSRESQLTICFSSIKHPCSIVADEESDANLLSLHTFSLAQTWMYVSLK